MNWADCSCCWPQKPFIRKAIGWTIYEDDPETGEYDKSRWTEIPPFWHLDISGWPKGHYDTWAEALEAARKYLETEQ
jgi:hypothetical protein